ncbi:GH25 family lysozyme [Bifidobacterium longum]|uniref:GH25 family lysozyme n=1 Tax=Bifidobacterium longum TaxID=216816 RepID=UPI00398D26C3
MVEKKRFDGSDAMDTTGMLRALRARATASGAVRGVTAAMASVAAMAMLGAVCVTPASALADVNADADASGVRSATSATRPVANGVTVADETAADAMPDNPDAELPDKVSAEISDDATVVSEQYAATPEGELKDIETGETVTDPKIVGTESKQPDPLAKTDGESFIPVSAADVKEKVAANGGDVNAVSSKTRAANASVKLAALQNNEYGAHWGTYNGTQAFFDARNNLFAQQAKGVIDVSVWQNTIDWQAVKNAGVEGAIIRLSYGWGNGFDAQAKRNISECKRLGIPFGVYVFSYAESAADGASEGADVVNLLRQAGVNPGDLSYPVFYDLENWTYTGHRSPTSPSVYDGIVNSWYGKLQAAGYNNLSVYSYTSYLNSALNSSNIHGKTRWVAQYGSTMQYTAFPTNDRGWQYTSSGQISGITGNVDLNAFGYRTPTTRYREVLIDGKWYYIDATTGKKVTGWQWLSSSGGKWVYYDPTDGHMLYGEQKIAGKWYYLNPVSGARMTGWVVLPDGRNVYYSPYMVYGEQKINGAWYYLDPVTGARKQGWQRLKSNGGKTVYYGSDGKMAYGEQTIDGKQYYLKLGTGARFAGWRRVVTTRDHRGDKWVYYGSDGAMLHGEGKVSGYWYFFDDVTSKSNGRVTYGWKNLGSKIVYYSWPEGKMQYGEQKIGGAWYYLNPMTGARKTGWQYLNSNGGKTVYYGSDGKMVYGTQYIDGQKYYFDPVTGAKR